MKKNSEHVLFDLPDYVEGRLDETNRARVKEHLGECERCRVECDELTGALSSIGMNRTAVPPPATYFATLVPRIHEALDKRRRRTVRIPAWIYRYALPITAVLVVTVVIFRGGMFRNDSSQATLNSIINQLSDDERLAVLKESPVTPQEVIDEYVVSDSMLYSFQKELREDVRKGTFEYALSPSDQQYAPETMIEALSPDEAEKVFAKLQSQDITS